MIGISMLVRIVPTSAWHEMDFLNLAPKDHLSPGRVGISPTNEQVLHGMSIGSLSCKMPNTFSASTLRPFLERRPLEHGFASGLEAAYYFWVAFTAGSSHQKRKKRVLATACARCPSGLLSFIYKFMILLNAAPTTLTVIAGP